jgi:archaellum component FlaC
VDFYCKGKILIKMTKQDQLPTYFKEYLDEKFNTVSDRFDGIDKQIADLKKNVASSNGRISKLWMALLVISIVLLFHFGESSLNILKIFKFL